MNNINETVENRMCSGCGICAAICPKNAISLQFNVIGNLYPTIDDNCVNCGLCQKVCPGSAQISDYPIEAKNLFVGNIEHAYIGRSLNTDIYKNSQSGGIVTALLNYLFDAKRIDAAIVAKSCYGYPYPKTEAIIITDAKQLLETQKSIYTPVPMMEKLKEVKQYKSVAIVGLPCQFEALKLAQDRGKYKNIQYKIGLICDRILSRSIYLSLMPDEWKQCDEYSVAFKDKSYPLTEKEYVAFFRDKNCKNYKTACMVYKSKDAMLPLAPYPRHHAKDFFTHPRCRVCFNKLNVFADVTCGDPWNMEGVDWVKGDSLILSRTHLGAELLSEATKDGVIQIKECKVDDVVRAQGIKSRQKRCLAGINIYRNHGWNLPALFKRIENSNIDKNFSSIYKQENLYVSQFLENENLSLDEILKKAEVFKAANARRMSRNILKTKIKESIKFIVKRILRKK